MRLPGHRATVKEDLRGAGTGVRGPHLVLLARDASGYRSLCRLVSRANMAGTKGVPRFSQALLTEHAEGLIALSGCRDGEIARRLLAGDREGALAVGERYARLFGGGGPRGSSARRRGAAVAAAGFVLELQHHLAMDDDWLVAETARLAEELGLPVVVTNDVHYALPEDRELHDVLTAIRHGRSLETLADLRSPSGEAYLKSAEELAGLPPGDEAATTDAGPPGQPGPGPRGSARRARSRPPARWSSASSATASRGSRCRTGRRRSAISRSCAGPARSGATTR